MDNRQPFFTEEEKTQFFSKYKQLVRYLSSFLQKEDVSKMKSLLKRVVALDCYGRDKNGINGLLRHIDTALIATHEIGLKRTSVIALLLYRPVMKQALTLDELYGIEREGKSWLTPYKKTLFGDMTEEKLQEAIDSVEEYGGGKINFIVCSRGVRRKLISALSAYRKTDSIDLEGGYRALSFNGIPVIADRFCPKGTMYLLNTDDFGLHQLCDWQWLEGEDGKILKQIPGKPVYTATLVKYAELMCYRPVGQGMLTGITE